MSSLSISAAWQEAKAILARDGRLFVTVTLALVVLPQIILAVTGSPVAQNASQASRLIYFAAVLLGITAQIALIRLALSPPVTVGEAISLGLARLLSVFGVVIGVVLILAIIATAAAVVLRLMGVVIVSGSAQPSPALIVLLLVLATLASAIFQLVFPVAAAETGNPLRLISRSWHLARGHYLRLLGFVVTILVAAGVVILTLQVGLGSLVVIAFGRPVPGSMSALLLGLIAATLQGALTVVSAVMLARIYSQLSGHGSAQASVPSSGI